MKVQAYPLQWPDHIPRTVKREKSRFKTTLHGALKNVQTSLRQFAADSGKEASNIVVSSNVSLGQDRPADPGVAIWFSWDGMSICIPVDRYLTAADNLQAIHHVLEARRTELRHGTLHLVRATFKGFAALPAPNAQGKTKMSWWQVLELDGPDASPAAVEAAYRRLAKTRHPDAGGSTEAMAALNAARMEAQQR
jgi:hypothetical protein